MTFFIYDPQGYRLPYYPDEWRRVPEAESSGPRNTFHSEQHLFEEDERVSLRDSRLTPGHAFTHRSLYQTGTSITAAQIMSRPVKSVGPSEPVDTVFELVSRGRLTYLPVINDNKRLIGLISDRWVTAEMLRIAKGRDLCQEPRFAIDLMVTNVLCTSPDTEISVIAEAFVELRVGAMPIVGDKEALVGIVTRTDILKTLVQVAPITTRG